MPKVVRRLVAKGPLYVIEYALLSDGLTSPSGEFVSQLRSGVLNPDPDHKSDDPWPDEEQPTDVSKLMSALRVLVTDGVPVHSRGVNYLVDGIWEFKIGAKRITFYDTDGMGGYHAKTPHKDRSTAPFPDDVFWWFPDFDNSIRLGHAFVKTSEKTSHVDIVRALEVRQEDLDHDKLTISQKDGE